MLPKKTPRLPTKHQTSPHLILKWCCVGFIWGLVLAVLGMANIMGNIEVREIIFINFKLLILFCFLYSRVLKDIEHFSHYKIIHLSTTQFSGWWVCVRVVNENKFLCELIPFAMVPSQVLNFLEVTPNFWIRVTTVFAKNDFESLFPLVFVIQEEGSSSIHKNTSLFHGASPIRAGQEA